uniref:Uncharacterized protein n=1 Tax=Cucumis sativus TaxID=3659 RepID=A0A0A0K5T4_CUCSA
MFYGFTSNKSLSVFQLSKEISKFCIPLCLIFQIFKHITTWVSVCLELLLLSKVFSDLHQQEMENLQKLLMFLRAILPFMSVRNKRSVLSSHYLT